ncbi:DUF1116 domain-containing protein [Arthrobacter sp. zg-Y1171]|uniref:DUF1116 domain-containing protein n=1 Tax=Arthrobacter sp. zg-Y1171 TaxID=2964610 RepID=UPI00210205B2|nr:DUF1116 domain-containing protein [Arthrobacter sp. zg-Y1171]MCQ1994014.1 DUF1116 domain-containing protein [Arthrobacter sp. zg-Y1171]UWX81875.1 DUF1116 domain-containing protein [Arthrobacter sp. zg-Y1171]
MTTTTRDASRLSANEAAVAAMLSAEPELIDVLPALEAVPGMANDIILVSGPLMRWQDYTGCQRLAVVGAAVFEGLAASPAEADGLLRSGAIRLASCHEYGAVGSLTGVCSASMPVLVVQDRLSGRTATCRMNEGAGTRALTFGSQGPAVTANLARIRDRVPPALARILRASPIPLLPIMAQALAMGDELHGRQTAAGLLFRNAVLERLLHLRGNAPESAALLAYLDTAEFHFLHVAMAAAKVIADTADSIPGSSIVTAMAMNEKEFAVRVSGLPGQWFRAPLPPISGFPGRIMVPWTPADLGYSGGDSLIMETLGLGGAAAAAAPALSPVSVGTPAQMMELTSSLYAVASSEHPTMRIPALGGRGVPWGMDAAAIVERRLVPPVHIGATLRSGGLAGAIYFTPPLQPFIDATERLQSIV